MSESADAFIDLMQELHLAYPDGTYSWRGKIPEVVALWERSFADIPPGVVMAAGRRWIETEPKLPHISELRALIAEAVAPVPTEADAFAAGMRWIRDQTEKPGDAFGVDIMKSMGSRRALGQMNEMDVRKSFGFAYRNAALKERTTRTANVDTMLGETTGRVALGGGK